MSSSKCPKLLFLAWNFPPVQTIASVRTWNIAKHLSRLDWDVTVVTPKADLWHHVYNAGKALTAVEAEGIHRIPTDHYWRCLTPEHMKCWNSGIGWVVGGATRRIARCLGIDWGIGWIKAAEQTCRRLTHDNVD